MTIRAQHSMNGGVAGLGAAAEGSVVGPERALGWETRGLIPLRLR
jgi:hypothetical protein